MASMQGEDPCGWRCHPSVAVALLGTTISETECMCGKGIP